jgi:hypothetical protein
LRSDDLDSVEELCTEDDFRQLVVTIEATPALLGGLSCDAAGRPTKAGGMIGRHCHLEILNLRQVLDDSLPSLSHMSIRWVKCLAVLQRPQSSSTSASPQALPDC